MEARVISSKGKLIVETPYVGTNSLREKTIEYNRSKRTVIDDALIVVRKMLKDTAETNRHVWWNKYPFIVSVRPHPTNRGEYIWSATKR